MKIKRFRGRYFSFSNTYPLDNWIKTEQGIAVPSSEHAYMANRFADPSIHYEVAGARGTDAGVLSYADAVAAKQVAYTYIEQGEGLLYTDDVERIAMMQRVVRAKLLANRAILELLLETGDMHIQEGNTWNDEFWGVGLATNRGDNHLGRIYMRLRDELATGVNENNQ